MAIWEFKGRELSDLEERRAGVEQPFDPLPWQQLAARRVPLARFLRAPERGLGNVGAKLLGKRAIMRGAGAKLVAIDDQLAVDPRPAHRPFFKCVFMAKRASMAPRRPQSA